MSDITDRISQLSPSKQLLFAMREMQARLEALERARTEPIAIIGLGCRFPGGAKDPDTFWKLLHGGVDTVTEVPADRWDVEAYYDPDPEVLGKMYVRQGAFLEQVDLFDPLFFSIAPQEAAIMDPQQRILLEVCWEALENAGQSPDELKGSQTGTFIGMMTSDYAQLLIQQLDSLHPESFLGAYFNGFDIAVGRLGYTLDFQGPSLAVDTACSSSLVTIHLACQSLRNKEYNLAVAGGVNLTVAPQAVAGRCQARTLAPDGRCKTFDAAANGYGLGEGCGLVVLKRLSDALDDHDNIWALIRGSAINQDGRSGGLTVPNGLAQQAVIWAALAHAGAEPAQVGYIEAHGTGTVLGDPIEVRALAAVLGQSRPPDRPFVLGSVKTNIGHLEAAAGVAGLIKTVLALHHDEIPPHLHLRTPNPHIPWDQVPAVIPTEPMAWPQTGSRRMAGISSFGVSGINAHVIVEAAPEQESRPVEVERPLQLFTLSAKSAKALSDSAGRFARHLAAHPDLSLADLCYTANAGRAHFAHRLAAVTKSASQLEEQLTAFAAGQKATRLAHKRVPQTGRRPKVAFLFSGQGVQYKGMGQQLYTTQPTFRQILDHCAAILDPILETPLLEILYGPDPKEEASESQIDQTAFAQPALFAIEYALAELWRSWEVEPDMVVGHSVGEYVAACVAGVFSLEEGLKLIAERGRLMQCLPGGTMAALFATEEQVADAIAPYAGTVSIAAVNTPGEVVISGMTADVEAILTELRAEGIRAVRLQVSHAFHSPMMEPILDLFEQKAREMNFAAPRLALISNLDGERVGADQVPAAGYWRRHLRAPVRFMAGMRTLEAEGCNVAIEIGPHPILLPLGKRCWSEEESEMEWHPSLHKGRCDWQQMLTSLAALYTNGVAVDWKKYDGDYERWRVPLPTYPFQQRRFWFEMTAPLPGPARIQAAGGHPLLGQPWPTALSEKVFESQIGVMAPSFLTDHRVYGLAVLPAAAYVEMALAAADSVLGTEPQEVQDLVLEEALILPDDEIRTIQVIVRPSEAGQATWQILSRGESPADWTLHATGQTGPLAPTTAKPPSLATIQKEFEHELAVEALYQTLSAAGIEYGPSFQGICRLWQQPGQVLGQIRLPQALLPGAGGYCLHPVLLDACIQLLAALVADSKEPTLTGTYLPVGIQRLRFYGNRGGTRPLSQVWCHVHPHSDPEAQVPAETLAGDLCLWDEEGRVIAEVEGLLGRRADQAVVGQSARSVRADWLHQIEWQLQAQATDRVLEKDKTWLVLADEGGIGVELARLLEEKGQDCLLATPDQAYARPERNRWHLDPSRPQDWVRLLAEAGETCQGIVHLWSLDSPATEGLTTTSLMEAQTRTCGSALHLVQALAEMNRVDRPRLWLVTRGSQAVDSSDKQLAVSQAPLWGLGRVIALEHPELYCTLVDLDPARETAAGDLVQELGQEGENLVSFHRGERYVARLVRSPARADRDPATTWTTRDTYLITGGLGSLGLRVAGWLVERGIRSLVLLGRKSPTGDATAAVEALRQGGTRVTVLQADAALESEMVPVLAKIEADLPPLRGVIHAAGVTDDGALFQQSWAQFERVLAPKVAGAWNLHKLTAGQSLDAFVLFSSAASVLGSPGVGNYAAANAFLDALAHYRHRQGLPALSINWGPWAQAGMAVEVQSQQRRLWAEEGVTLIEPEQALQTLAHLLEQPSPQVGVMPVDWSQLIRSLGSDRPPPLLSKVAADVPQAPAVSKSPRPDLERPFVAPSTPEEEKVAEIWAQILGLEQVGVNDDFFELGGHSLLAARIIAQARATFQVELHLRRLFEKPTVANMAREIQKTRGARAQPPKSTIPRLARGRHRTRLTAGGELEMPEKEQE